MAKRTGFQDQIETHLIDFKEKQQFLPSRNPKKNWQYFSIDDNLYPPTRHSFLQYAYDNAVPFHDYVNHVRSSQIFGINLFYPIMSEVRYHPAILGLINALTGRNDNSIVNYWFEYTAEKDLLGEWPGTEPPSEYVTASDVVIETRGINKGAIYFLEVKFSESEFSPCGGYTSRGNSSKFNKPCQSCRLLAEDPSRCYLHIPQPRKSPRKYFNYFDMKVDFPGLNIDGSCPFISNHQCLRNHALARATRKEKGLAACYFGLVYHEGNADIAAEWQSYRELTSGSKELLTIEASRVVAQVPDKTYQEYFKKRYKVGK